jgi:type II secretory pathway component PulC
MELRLSDRHIVALNVLLVTVLAYFAILAGKDLLALRSSAADAPVLSRHSRIANFSPANQSRAAYQAIVDRDIFNMPQPPAPPAPVVVEDLHITLVGVSQASKGKPFAIVADEQGEQSVYRVGEIIPDSGKLLEVDKDRAIVEHGGRQVVLELPKDDMGDSAEGFASTSTSLTSNGSMYSVNGSLYRRRMSVSEASGNDAMAHFRARRGYNRHRE